MIVTEKFDNFLLVTFDESGKTIIFLASKKLTTGLLNMQTEILHSLGCHRIFLN